MLYGAQDDNYSYRLYLIDMSSGEAVPLTHRSMTISDGAASWSSAGIIAYTGSYIDTAEGSIRFWRFPNRFTSLTENVPGDDYFPAWSPDGNEIAFVSKRDGTQRLYVMNRFGEAVRPLAVFNGSSWDMAWSPDSAKLAFTASERYMDDVEELVIADVLTGDVQWITDNELTDSAPDWSPDGTRVIWSSGNYENSQIMLYNVDTGETSALTHDNHINRFPLWSPDGTRIAYESSPVDSGTQIYLMNADGSDQETLPPVDAFPMAWSPDGTALLFVARREGRFDLYTLHLSDNSQQRLTEAGGIDMTWRPQWVR